MSKSTGVKGLEKRGDIYHINIPGCRKSCNTGDKKLAIVILGSERKKMAENRHLDIKRECKMSLKEFILTKYYLSEATHKKGFETYERVVLNAFIRDYPALFALPLGIFVPNENRPNPLQQWKLDRTRSNDGDERDGRVKKASVNRELGVLSAVFNYAKAEKLILISPFAEVKRWKLTKAEEMRQRDITPAELDKLLEECLVLSQEINDKFIDMILIYLGTGMRKSEVMKLKRTQLEFTRGEVGAIKISEQKNGDIDYQSMTGPVRDILLKRFAINDHPVLIFSGPSGKPYNFRTVWEKARKNAGLEDVRLHDLRHAYACLLRDRGVDIYTIKEMMRHKQLSQTQRYVHPNERLKIEASKKLNDINITNIAQKSQKKEKEEFNSLVSSINPTN